MDLTKAVSKETLTGIKNYVGVPTMITGGTALLRGLFESRDDSDLDTVIPLLAISIGVIADYKFVNRGISSRIGNKVSEWLRDYAGQDGNGIGMLPAIATHTGIYTLCYTSGKIIREGFDLIAS